MDDNDSTQVLNFNEEVSENSKGTRIKVKIFPTVKLQCLKLNNNDQQYFTFFLSPLTL